MSELPVLLPDAIAAEILAEHGVAGISDWITLTLDTARDLGWRIVRESEDDPHHVTFTDHGWAIEHSAACRNAGSMLDCSLDAELRELCTGPPPQGPGRYVVEHLEHGFDFLPAPDEPATTALLFIEEWRP